MNVINKQYDNVCLKSSNTVRINSVVLLRNISYESKREPLKLARVSKIKESRDGSQRVVTVTYHNISVNRKGEWVGTPVEVERCVKDVILVDTALNDSTLSPTVVQTTEEDMPIEAKQKSDSSCTGDTTKDDSVLNPITVQNTDEGMPDEVD